VKGEAWTQAWHFDSGGEGGVGKKIWIKKQAGEGAEVSGFSRRFTQRKPKSGSANPEGAEIAKKKGGLWLVLNMFQNEEEAGSTRSMEKEPPFFQTEHKKKRGRGKTRLGKDLVEWSRGGEGKILGRCFRGKVPHQRETEPMVGGPYGSQECLEGTPTA